jgi:hypothetical protein
MYQGGRAHETAVQNKGIGMKPVPPRPGATPEPSQRNALLSDIPGGVPILRAAVEELLKSSWDEPFRRRALEIAGAFEGSFGSCGRADLAALVHTLILLLEIKPEEVVLLGSALPDKLSELLTHLEARLRSDGGLRTG